MEWFTVDKAGLAKLLDKKGKAFAIFELLQNSWDTNAKRVNLTIEPVSGRPYAQVFVEDDDPDGFKNLAHAYTMFAESEKKGDPSKRGRFNLGEKLVLALCEKAEIISTKGSVYFTSDGRSTGKKRLERGSYFLGTMRMTRSELDEVSAAIATLIPPDTCETVFNGAPLPKRSVVKTFEATLPTVRADAEGYLTKTQRACTVTTHEVREGETPTLYEMGIPVVEFGGGEKWHVNVGQKIPLNADRDNVTPSYLQTLRVSLANEMREHITKEDARAVWVNAATEDERILPETMERVLDQSFGKKRAILDPSDPEANKELQNRGYTVIPGGALSGAQWSNVKSHGLAQPSGKILPSGVQYGYGPPEKVIPEEEWTPGQRFFAEYVINLAWKLIKRDIRVRIVNEPIRRAGKRAWYGNRTVTFNLGSLGKAWFEGGFTHKHNELIIHELAHELVEDHLTHEFSNEVGRLGCKLTDLMFTDREFFVRSGYKSEA